MVDRKGFLLYYEERGEMMKSRKRYPVFGVMTLSALLLSGCQQESPPLPDPYIAEQDAVTTPEEMKESEQTGEETEEMSAAEEEKNTEPKDGIADAIAQETAEVDIAPIEADENEERIPTAEIAEVIPAKYKGIVLGEAGTIEKITYTAHDYFRRR